MKRRRSLGFFGGPGGSWARGSLLVLVLLSIAMLVLDRARPEQSPFLFIKRTIADAAEPSMSVLSAPFRSANQLVTWMGSNWKAAKRVRELEQDNRNLLQWRDLALALHEKMGRYEELLGAPQAPTPVVITARTITDSGGPFVRARLINAGREDGVAEGQAVLAHNGLVGRVMSVGNTAARVLLLTDLNSRVPVFIVDTGGHAILAGDNTSVPHLIYVARDVDVEIGMRVVTSGEDGVLPRGLAVGQITQVDEDGVRVSLFAHPERVDFVRVLKMPPISLGKDTLNNAIATQEEENSVATDEETSSQMTPEFVSAVIPEVVSKVVPEIVPEIVAGSSPTRRPQ